VQITLVRTQLARNPQLSKFVVRDLNASPDGWSLADATYDACICCASIQYFSEPERVFAEVFRVLKPGGVAIFSFSTRMFATKAIAAWRDGTSYSRVAQVKSYFQAVRGFSAPEVVTAVPVTDTSLFGLLRRACSGALRGVAGASALASVCCSAHETTTLANLPARRGFLQSSAGDPFFAVIARREA
jgi:SAM-dependent methyltransferase